MDVAPWLIDGFTVASVQSADASGKPTYATQRAIKGCVRTVDRKIFTPQGVAIQPQSVFITDQPIAMGDRLWLNGADTTDATKAKRLGTVRSQHGKDGEVALYQVDL